MTASRFASLARLLGRTSDPTPTPVAGEMWYRTDRAQVHAAHGSSGVPITVGPTGNLPAPRAGAWHLLPAYGAPATANVPTGRLFAVPFWPGRRATVTGLAVNVSLALLGGQIRMGLYASDGVLPTSLIADYGTVTSDIAGVKQITSMSTLVQPVLHFLVVGRQGGGLNLGLSTRATGDPIISETAPSIAANLNAYYVDGVGGALPALYGTPAGSDTGPALQIRLS